MSDANRVPDAEKVAVVTGGTAGIGRAIAKMLLDRGMRVAVIARGEDRLEAMEVQYGEDRLLAISADVAEAEAVDAAATSVMERWGRIDVWVNDAMLTEYARFRDMPARDFETVVDATFLGQVNGARAALRHMRRGNIVFVGSGLSYRGIPMQSAYSAAKFAINGFVQSLRAELMHDEVPVTLSLVQLPAVNTPQFDWAKNQMPNEPKPAGTIYQPEVAARAVMRAIDGGNREIFVGGSVLQLVFGNIVAPWLLDRRLAASGAEMQQSDRPDPDPSGNLHRPSRRAGTAHGSYDAEARAKGLIVDADRARGLAFVGVPLLALALGALAGRASRR